MKLARPRPERLVLAGGLLITFLLCLGPVSNPDMPWHLAVGRSIAADRAVPRTDFLSWTMAGRPWVDFEWLTQLLFHGLDRAAGVTGLWCYKVLSFCLLAAAVSSLFALWGLSEVWIGLSVFSVFAALRPFIQIRPENFSLIFFTFQLILLEARRLGRLKASDTVCLAGHFALYTLWANLHAGFPMGLLLCACYGAAERFSAARSKRLSPLAWAAVGVAGTCVNPYGPRLYGVLWDHLADQPYLRVLINEWAAPRMGSAFLAGYWFLLAFALAGFIASVAQGSAPPAEHVLAAVVFGLAATRALRTTAYVTLLVFPLGLLSWSRVAPPDWWKRARPWVLSAVAMLAVWSVGAVMVRDGFLRVIKPTSDLEIENAAVFLRAETATLSGLKMFNPWNWGGYLDNTLYPRYRVFMDGRYIFTDLLKEVDEADKNPTRWTKFMDKYGVELALLMNTGRIVSYRGQTSWRAFDSYALPQSDWALIYWDRQVLIFVRRSRVPGDWLKRREFRLIHPHDLRYLGLRVLSGWVTFAQVEEEIGRYKREIGDPFETLVLEHWLENFKKGLNAPAPAARRSPRPNSNKAAASKP